MTLAEVIMLGAGIILIISALENSSLIKTVQVIWSGQPISTLTPSTTSSTP